MQKLIQGLHKFQSEVVAPQKDFFRNLASGQEPVALFITCSDSRINPNLLTQTGPGDLFILRNAGNLVPPYDDGNGAEAATIEFALAGLGVQHVILCGHTQCGAMKGVLDPKQTESMPAVRRWLRHAEATRRVIEENYTHLEGPARLTATVEENVLSQIENLRTHPSVRAALSRGKLSIYGWVYKIQTGEVFQYEHERGQFSLLAEADKMLPVPAVTVYRGLNGQPDPGEFAI